MWVQEEFTFFLVLAVRQTFSSLMTVPFFNRNNDIKKQVINYEEETVHMNKQYSEKVQTEMITQFISVFTGSVHTGLLSPTNKQVHIH